MKACYGLTLFQDRDLLENPENADLLDQNNVLSLLI